MLNGRLLEIKNNRKSSVAYDCGDLLSTVLHKALPGDGRRGPYVPVSEFKTVSHVGVLSNFPSLDIAVGILARKDIFAAVLYDLYGPCRLSEFTLSVPR